MKKIIIKTFAFIRTIVSYSLVLIVGVIAFLPCTISALLPEPYKYNKIYFFFADLFFKSVIYFSFLPVNIIGKENLPKDTQAIFAANHQSALDIPVMGYVVGSRPHIWMVLDYYTKTFLLGFFVRHMNISVNQKNPKEAANALILAIKYLNKYKNMSLIIFPEGRRIKEEGNVSSFMKGFAIAAKSTGLPIIPVYMPNNGKVYPINTFLIRYYPLDIIIGPAFYYKQNDTDESFSSSVHSWFVSQSKKYS